MITKFCRQQAEGITIHENANGCDIKTDEVRPKKYERYKFGGCQSCDHSSD
jgi:hypothetical protein